MASQNQGSQKFSISFVEDIRQSLVQHGETKRRLLGKRPAAIQALMVIDKTSLEIQRDLQSAFTRIVHGSR